jgi:hypothetical protein
MKWRILTEGEERVKRVPEMDLGRSSIGLFARRDNGETHRAH